MDAYQQAWRITLVFGGPSSERNISCGSLKPWVTYLDEAPSVETTVLFFDEARRAFLLPAEHHYTNTCEDFLPHLREEDALKEEEILALLRESDLVVPLVHGELGEDGELQRLVERAGSAYLFSEPMALETSLDKLACHRTLGRAGLGVPRFEVVQRQEWGEHRERELRRISEYAACATPRPDGMRLAIKPARGGSSFGVSLVDGGSMAIASALEVAFELDSTALVEEVLEGPEFSVIVIEGDSGEPVALCPTEVESRRGFFTNRAKFLEGEDARFHTPHRRIDDLPKIRRAAVDAWHALGMRHMARFDGFVQGGRVLITDVNGISGFGFSSFVFQQASMVGFSHASFLEYLIRLGLRDGGYDADHFSLQARADQPGAKREVVVLLGGTTSERHVSRKSGVFAGLCLDAMGFEVRYVLMDLESRFTDIGLFYALHHNVDEIHTLIRAERVREEGREVAIGIAKELGIPEHVVDRRLDVGSTGDLPSAVKDAQAVFLGLHGGAGEDGRVQAALAALGVPFNGPGWRSSWSCADKDRAAAIVDAARLPGVRTPRRVAVRLGEMQAAVLEATDADWALWWRDLCRATGSDALVIKPSADGCSTGVKVLRSATQLRAFCDAVVTMRSELPYDAVWGGAPTSWRIVQLPEPPARTWMVEQAFVEGGPAMPETWDASGVRAWASGRRYLELTCAVTGDSEGLGAAHPSITIASGDALSIEEKFQQGVGTNLALDLVAHPRRVQSVRERIVRVAVELGITGYSRIDFFYDQELDELILIEANTLCGLTEATVFFTQMLQWKGLSPARAVYELIAHRLPPVPEPVR